MKVLQDYDLTAYNSFGVSVFAAYFVAVEELDDLFDALDFAKANQLPVQILGGGSNTLFIDDYPGLICRLEMTGIEILGETGLVRVAAAENWHELVAYCLRKGLHGIENLALIPGTVGAAPIQNIGAYGVELADVFVELEALDRDTDEIIKFNRKACDFGYRDSVFKHEGRGRYVVLWVVLQLSTATDTNTSYGALKQRLGASGASPQQVFDAVCEIRRSKLPDPKLLGNAGSFFKNPIISTEKHAALQQEHGAVPSFDVGEPDFVKIPAAWLLDKAGWKGRQRGKAAVHQEHALVLVNTGGARGEEILLLAQEMSSAVLSQFGIALEPEVQII